MHKSWKLTAAFAGVLVVLCAVYFVSSPTATTPLAKLDEHVLSGLTSDQVTKIEVVRKDGVTMTFEKASDIVGEYWRIVEQSGHAAEQAMVQQLLFALDRYVRTGSLDEGRPETAPDLTGLADPRMTVAYSTQGGRREVLRFGKQPPTNTTSVFYQKEGDPKIYLVGVETYDAFTKPPLQYRSKNLVRFAAHRINKVELSTKFVRLLEKGKPGVVEYENSVMVRSEEGAERGWYLVAPHRERLNDHAVAMLVSRLADLQATDYQPVGDLGEKGLSEPEVKVALFGAGDATPVAVSFGAPAKGGKRWVWPPGGAEAALCDGSLYDEDIPLQRSKLRVSVVFPFSSELAKRVEIEVKDLGKVVLDRKELKKEGEPVSTWKWEVLEPNNLKVESERLEAFVAAIVNQEIVGFLGPQDFKLAGLDPAPVKLKVTTKEGKDHVCGFFASKAQGFLRKEGVNEIFEVRPELVRMLQRLELNFVSMDMFSVPRDSIRSISFELRLSAELQHVYYKLKRDGGKWVFDDPANVKKGIAPNPDKLDGLLTTLNYIKAESLLARDQKTIADMAVEELTAPATLKLGYVIGQGQDAKEGVLELYISSDKSDMPSQPRYYARMKDNPTVFQISSTLVLQLQKFLKIEDKSDQEK
ncbi:MAG TPA: DUF4340 domain-containing protein [Planctomycetota bacterium]|nr:DUF4340 domain-containing protein [Planctomycetota bacterium]